MDLDDLRRISSDAKLSVFRLETLPQYLVPDTSLRHAEPLTDYLARKGLTPETLRMTG